MESSIPVLYLTWLSVHTVGYTWTLPSSEHPRNIGEICSISMIAAKHTLLPTLSQAPAVIMLFYGHIFHLFLSKNWSSFMPQFCICLVFFQSAAADLYLERHLHSMCSLALVSSNDAHSPSPTHFQNVQCSFHLHLAVERWCIEGEELDVCDWETVSSKSKCLQILRLSMNKGKRFNRSIDWLE